MLELYQEEMVSFLFFYAACCYCNIFEGIETSREVFDVNLMV